MTKTVQVTPAAQDKALAELFADQTIHARRVRGRRWQVGVQSITIPASSEEARAVLEAAVNQLAGEGPWTVHVQDGSISLAILIKRDGSATAQIAGVPA